MTRRKPDRDSGASLKECHQLCFSSSQQQLAIAGPSGASGSSAVSSKPEVTFYDDLYFDSDEDDGDGGDPNETDPKPSGSGFGKSPAAKSRREVKSNDDLMYDPDLDDEDQAWVDNIRKQYQSKLRAWVKSSSCIFEKVRPF